MKSNLNEEMKRTLFEISLAHLQKQKKLLTPKSASRILINYKKALRSESNIPISEDLCQELSDRFKQLSSQEILSWLDSVFC